MLIEVSEPVASLPIEVVAAGPLAPLAYTHVPVSPAALAVPPCNVVNVAYVTPPYEIVSVFALSAS